MTMKTVRMNNVPFFLMFTKPVNVTFEEKKMIISEDEAYTLTKVPFKTWLIFRAVPLVLISLLLFRFVSPVSFLVGFILASGILALVEYFKKPIIAVAVCFVISVLSLYLINTLQNANYYIREVIQAFAFSLFYASIIRDYLMRNRFDYFKTNEKNGLFVRVEKWKRY